MNDEMKKLIIDDTSYNTRFTKKFERRKFYHGEKNNEIRAFIPGTIREISVKQGDLVKKGDKLLVLEAMKMKNRIFSPINGKVKKIYIETEQRVAKNDILIELEF